MESPMTLNGGAMVAMAGKECFAIASDLRYGIATDSGLNVTIAENKEKIFRVGTHSYVGLFGLIADTDLVLKRLTFRKNLYELREKRSMKPAVLSSVISNMLYEKRFGMYFVRPIVACLDPVTWQPYLSSMDVIGCNMVTEDFVVAGTCQKQLYGSCESMWMPDMKPDDLFEACGQVILNSCDRDPSAGWGAVVHVVEKNKITTKTLKTRMD